MDLMERQESIFNIYERRQPTPHVFQWTSCNRPVKITPELFVFEGKLVTIKENVKMSIVKQYVLTLTSLIDCISSPRNGLIHASRMLPLRNPRVKKRYSETLKL